MAMKWFSSNQINSDREPNRHGRRAELIVQKNGNHSFVRLVFFRLEECHSYWFSVACDVITPLHQLPTSFFRGGCGRVGSRCAWPRGCWRGHGGWWCVSSRGLCSSHHRCLYSYPQHSKCWGTRYQRSSVSSVSSVCHSLSTRILSTDCSLSLVAKTCSST